MFPFLQSTWHERANREFIDYSWSTKEYEYEPTETTKEKTTSGNEPGQLTVNKLREQWKHESETI